MMRRNVLQTIGALLGGYGVTGVAKVMPMASLVKPRHVICFLGQWKSLSAVEKVVAEFGRGFSVDMAYSQEKPDPRMESAFAASADRVSKTFVAKDLARVKHHSAVAYVLSPPIDREKAVMVSISALQLTARLIQAGATAVKSESAGIAHGLDHWLYLAQKEALRPAWVRRPIREKETLYSCGMHLLGQPDIECAGSFEELEAVRWMDALSEHAMSGQLNVNNPYSVDAQTPKKRLRLVPCERYAEDDLFFNPYGYVRIAA